MNKNLKDRADRLLSSIYLDGYEHGCKDALQNISNYVVEQEPKTGRYVYQELRKEEYVIAGRCSVCGKVRVVDNFCSCCGAKMQSEDKDG